MEFVHNIYINLGLSGTISLLLFSLTVIAVVLLYAFVVYVYCPQKSSLSKFGKRFLIVIAHPDDECMFFAPTIQQIKSTSRHPETFTDIFILCLSIGETEQLIRDFYKQGNVRKKELIQSCSILGVPLGNVFIIQHTKMPDSPHCIWRDDLVGRIILKYTNMLSADVVISFDEHGVSGHPNHISLFNGLSYLTDEDLVPVGCRFLVLKTVNKLRKYCSIFDFPLSFCEDDCVLISSPLYILRAQKAMTAHYSQLVWFRWLYILFSRYMIINSLVELKKKNKTD